jgi:Family of unknown function (DUF6348)
VEVRINLQDWLEPLLRDHGLETSRYKDWVLVGGDLPGISASCAAPVCQENGCSARLDVEVLLAPGRMLKESFGGSGTDEDEAIGNAFYNFCQSSLHVFLAGFWGRVDDDQVAVEHWRMGGGSWRAVVGNFVRRSYGGESIPVPDGAFEAIEGTLKGMRLAGDLHWVRTYYCNLGTGEVVIEALLDNETWVEGEEALRILEWPPSENFYSVRNFFLIQREA